jgi:CBS domain-containing protein
VEEYLVRDLMVPVADYPTVQDNASVLDAVLALEKAQPDIAFTNYRPRALLVLDNSGRAIGKVSLLDLLRALEPRYQRLEAHNGMSHYGFSREFIRLSLEEYSLWDTPLDQICEKVVLRQVQEFMHAPTPGEFVTEDTSLDAAIHQLIVGKHQSLLVTRDGKITGILLLSDVFFGIFQIVKESCSCRLADPERPGR